MKKYYNSDGPKVHPLKECHYCSSIQPSNLMEKKTIRVHVDDIITCLEGKIRVRKAEILGVL